MTVKARLSAPLRKAASVVMRWSRGRGWGMAWLGGSRRDWAQSVKDGGRSNGIVTACINWVQTAFPEAPVMVYRRGGDGKQAPWADHPMLALLETPNPYYTGEHLWAATVADRLLTGNAYWLKVRSGGGQPVQLWWIPSNLMEPAWPDNDDTVFIDHYDYRLEGGKPQSIPPEDVVHFRYGFDPKNVRKGLSPLHGLLREIASDDEAANWTASLLGNMGIPGVIIAPDADVEMDDTDAEVVKDKFQQRFSGDLRGAPLVMTAPTKVSVLSFNPEQMQLKDLRRVPEERVSAALGIPAIVAGLGAGLDRSTFANYGEAREAAYESHIIPTYRLLGAELRTQLVPDFGDPAQLRVGFDVSQVRALQQDQDALHARARENLLAGLFTRNQALIAIGEEPEDGSDVLYLSNNLSVVPVDDPLGLREQAARVTVADTSTAATGEPPADAAKRRYYRRKALGRKERLRWRLGTGGASGTHCPRCVEMAERGWMSADQFEELDHYPGDGWSWCGDFCTCEVEFENDKRATLRLAAGD